MVTACSLPVDTAGASHVSTLAMGSHDRLEATEESSHAGTRSSVSSSPLPERAGEREGEADRSATEEAVSKRTDSEMQSAQRCSEEDDDVSTRDDDVSAHDDDVSAHDDDVSAHDDDVSAHEDDDVSTHGDASAHDDDDDDDVSAHDDDDVSASSTAAVVAVVQPRAGTQNGNPTDTDIGTDTGNCVCVSHHCAVRVPEKSSLSDDWSTHCQCTPANTSTLGSSMRNGW